MSNLTPRRAIAAVLTCAVCAPSVLRAAGTPFPGTDGAIQFTVDMPVSGKATLALYNERGLLVRILGQMIPLEEGRYTVRWDGMDLWGNLLPDRTTLEAKLFANKGLRTYYEFTAGLGDMNPRRPSWLTKPMGEGMGMRTGGWLGDHTGPGAAAAIGQRVFLGASSVEHGHPVIACDLEGNKLWGGRLAGWSGPEQMWAVGDAVLAKVKNAVFRINPESYESRQLFSTEGNGILAMGCGSRAVHLVLKNHEARISPFRLAGGHGDVDLTRATPQMLGGNAPDFQISPSRQFTTVFFSGGGHFQTGIKAVCRKGAAEVIVPFRTQKEIGTLVLERIPGVERLEAFVLKPGKEYKIVGDAPAGGSNAELGDLLEEAVAGLDLDDFNSDWQVFGNTTFPERVVFLSAPNKGLATGALKLKFHPPKGSGKDFQPYLAMCRILRNRVEPIATVPRIIAAADAKSEPVPKGWRLRTSHKVSEDEPSQVIVDYGAPATFDGLAFLNHTSTHYTVEAFIGAGDPARASDDGWTEIAGFRSRHSRKYGSDVASTIRRSYFIGTPVTTARALRFRFTGAHGKGKVKLAWTEDDPFRLDCAFMTPLRLLDSREKPEPHICQVRDVDTGEVATEDLGDFGNVSHLAADSADVLYAVADNALARAEIADGGFRLTRLADLGEGRVHCLKVINDELIVGAYGTVRFFSRDGTLLRTIGGATYERGPWDANRVGKASSVTVDRNGKIWIAEASYSPKRVARFTMDGRCEKELFGPPQYGGGGWLDPNLKSFYYRGMEFELDWDAGTSRLRNLNDRLYTEESPAMDGSSFAYTQIGRPIIVDGRRYVVGDPGRQFSPGPVVCLLDGPVWKPCAVMGSAEKNPFLLRKDSWSEHWKERDLVDCLFIWLDLNGDGAYQIEEVDLFPAASVFGNPFGGGYWGKWMGPDLTVWSGSARLAPAGFTEHDVPLYRKENIRSFNYEDLAPRHGGLETWGSRAKPEQSHFSLVCADGSWIQAGQPYRVLPDLTIAGGPVEAQPTGYVPPINGERINHALHYGGTAVTDSPVGEVAVLVGNHGVWSVTSVRDRVLLDQVFTGRDGGWSTDLSAERGIEVTGRKHDWETFFGHFTKAHDGNYYAVAGKGFHGICRVEGLDDYQVTKATVTVTSESVTHNRELRELLVSRDAALAKARAQQRANKQTRVPEIDKLPGRHRFDGYMDEYGQSDSHHAMDEQFTATDPLPAFFFSAAHSSDGLILAYRGRSGVGNHPDDPRYLFKAGFAVDFRYRIGRDAKQHEVLPGDRRILLGRQKGKWLAVLYDYRVRGLPDTARERFSSPVVTTTIDRVTVLPADAFRIEFVEDNIDMASTGSEATRQLNAWSAEVFLPWKTLGFPRRPSELCCDVGVMVPDSGGQQVERRVYWSNPLPLTVSDLGAEAEIHPGTWGTFTLD